MDINKRSSSGEWIHLCNPLCYYIVLNVKMCCFIPWQGQDLRMFLASECGRLHALSAQSIFRSSFVAIHFRILMPSAPIDNRHLNMAQQICFDPGWSSNFWLGDDRMRRMSAPFPCQRPLNWVQPQIDKREVSSAQWSLMLNPAIPVCTLILHGVCRCTVYMDELSCLQIISTVVSCFEKPSRCHYM
jgi:hypothetical protein